MVLQQQHQKNLRAVEAWRSAAEPGLRFMANRFESAGLMHLVLRLWREQVEHDAPEIWYLLRRVEVGGAARKLGRVDIGPNTLRN